jgi:hypothetical protein
MSIFAKIIQKSCIEEKTRKPLYLLGLRALFAMTLLIFFTTATWMRFFRSFEAMKLHKSL